MAKLSACYKSKAFDREKPTDESSVCETVDRSIAVNQLLGVGTKNKLL